MPIDINLFTAVSNTSTSNRKPQHNFITDFGYNIAANMIYRLLKFYFGFFLIVLHIEINGNFAHFTFSTFNVSSRSFVVETEEMELFGIKFWRNQFGIYSN